MFAVIKAPLEPEKIIIIKLITINEIIFLEKNENERAFLFCPDIKKWVLNSYYKSQSSEIFKNIKKLPLTKIYNEAFFFIELHLSVV